LESPGFRLILVSGVGPKEELEDSAWLARQLWYIKSES
jgi:hypothetical protein